MKTIDPLRSLLQSYRGPFSQTRQFIRSFTAKTRINFEKGNYIVKTVENGAELEEVLKLRYEVFHREYMNKRFPFGMDIDRYDRLADFLIIVDKKQSRIVGTYRLISSLHSNTFYSESEFNLRPFLECPGTKLELSRACIQRDFRTGAVMNLLWRGISQFIQEVGAKYLFGCASIKTVDMKDAVRIYQWLRDAGHIYQDHRVIPTPDYRLENYEAAIAKLPPPVEASKELGKTLIPPLFQSYLKMGARVCSEPALDREFRCIDFLTVLNVAELARTYERKYVAN